MKKVNNIIRKKYSIKYFIIYSFRSVYFIVLVKLTLLIASMM